MTEALKRKRVICSLSHTIYENLALENYLFNKLDSQEELLFLWKNTDAVVIGRFQDPELECNLGALTRDGVPLARRQSGGGTVWHDLGNLCFTFMGPKAFFDRRKNLILIKTALEQLGFPAELNERHDILLYGKKISGSAFREKADRAFHHGTLLIASQLDKLHYYLSPQIEKPRSRHTRSVPSPVTQLSLWNPDITITEIENKLKELFSTEPAECISAEQVHTEAEFADYLEFLQSRDWIYGPGEN
jgi:lipoate-protein ligase A